MLKNYFHPKSFNCLLGELGEILPLVITFISPLQVKFHQVPLRPFYKMTIVTVAYKNDCLW